MPRVARKGAAPTFPILLAPPVVRRTATTFRAPNETLTLLMPEVVGHVLAERCDGSRSAGAIAHEVRERFGLDLEDALEQLRRAGALTNARDVGAALWRFLAPESGESGDSASELARDERLQDPPSAPAHVMSVPPSRWRASLARGSTTRDFAPAALSAPALATLLWSAYGVLPAKAFASGPHRRTVVSAEALHPVVLHLVLYRAAGEIGPGVYRVTSRRPYEVELTPVGRGGLPPQNELLHDPRPLRGANGVLAISASFARGAPKHGAHALARALMEAGRAAQNFHLSASERGLATFEAAPRTADLRAALALPRPCEPLVAIVFGASAEKADASFDARLLRIVQVPRRVGSYRMPGALAVVEMEGGLWTTGRAPTRALAELKGRAEAAERIACERARQRPPVLGSFVDLRERAVDPRSVLAYAPGQIRRSSPVKAFDPRAPYEWFEVEELRTARRRLMLADLVGPSLDPRAVPYAFYTTSGAAAHTSRELAIERGLLELVERDAFMVTWLNGLARPRLRPSSLPKTLRARIAAFEQQGFDVHVIDMTLDLTPAVLMVVVHAGMPLLSCSAGSDFTRPGAIERALGEAEASLFPQLHGAWCGPIVAPREVQAVQHHGALYKDASNIERARFLTRGGLMSLAEAERRGGPRSFADLLAALASRRMDVLVADLRKGDAVIESTPFHVVKVAVPGLVPITFGCGLEPLGLPRVRRAPKACGLRRTELALERLNRFPHPFA